MKQARKPDDKWHCVLSLCRAQRDDDDDVSVGRPFLSVDMYEVEFLRSLGFTWTDIARCLDVSRSTLYRRLDESYLLCVHQLRERQLNRFYNNRFSGLYLKILNLITTSDAMNQFRKF